MISIDLFLPGRHYQEFKFANHSFSVNFQKVNSECINLDDFNSCMAEPQVKISSLPDIYFDTLAMMYTAEECR